MARSARKMSWFVAFVLVAGLSIAGAGAPVAGSQVCGTWSIVSSPNPAGEFDDGLSSLAVVSPTDIWAVGASGTYGAARSTLAEHWNGSAWTITPTPNGPNEVNWLLSADAVTSTNVWAVGYSATNPPEQSFRRTLIERWNGTAWTVVPSPNPTPPLSGGPVSNELYGVAAVSANDVWAVGVSMDFGAGQTLIEHWNGSTWSVVPAPHPGEFSWLRSVSAVSATDVWAVGTHYVNGSQVTLILHWNGSAWTVVSSPNDGPFTQELFRVRAVSANDVWAVGYHLAVFGFSQVFQTSIFHWNGSAWSVVPSPDVNQRNNYLWSVDGTSATDAWAVGFFDTGFELRTMTQHWDGTSWTIVSSPNASDVIDEPSDVAAISPTDVWTVGQTANAFDFDTLTMHRTGSCGGGGTTLFPTSVTIQAGSSGGGTAASLGADDNVFLVVRATKSAPRTATWYGTFTGVSNAATSIQATYKGKSSATCTQTISMFRWTDSAWVQLDSRSVGTTEVEVANLAPPGTLADFVSGTSGNGDVRVRVSCSGSAAFALSGDLMKLVA